MVIDNRGKPLPDGHWLKGKAQIILNSKQKPLEKTLKEQKKNAEKQATRDPYDLYMEWPGFVCRAEGAVTFLSIIPVLASSKRAKSSLKKALGNEAVEMLKSHRLEGDLGDDIYSFFVHEIHEEGNENEVWRGIIFTDPDDEENVDAQYPVGVCNYEGVYFVWALEYDDVGYFLDRKYAINYALTNWDVVKPVPR